MIHQMKLKAKYYDYIKNGTKRIELRLYDEKRSKIQIGDEIEFFKEPELTESIKLKVRGLLKYQTFIDLVEDIDISLLADKSITKEELLDILETFYPIEQQKQYGVIGIRLEK